MGLITVRKYPFVLYGMGTGKAPVLEHEQHVRSQLKNLRQEMASHRLCRQKGDLRSNYSFTPTIVRRALGDAVQNSRQ